MPVILVARAQHDRGPETTAWKKGQIVNVFRTDHEFSTAELPESLRFYHITVTDKTYEEGLEFINRWNHNPTVTQIQNNGDDRRILVTSDMVSVSGKNAFIQADVETLLEKIGGVYVAHTNNSFRFDITATIEEKDEIILEIEHAVAKMQYARRRWGITVAGQAFLAGNGNKVSGPASTVMNYLRDGLLD